VSEFTITESDISGVQYLHYRELPPVKAVYLLKNMRTRRVYVGRSKDVRYRAAAHMSTLRGGSVTSKLMLADFQEHGEESFRFGILSECDNFRQLFWRERSAIALCKALAERDGVEHYNIQDTKFACHQKLGGPLLERVFKKHKTVAQRKAEERQRHKAAGRVAVTLYIYPEDRASVALYIKRLNKRRKRDQEQTA
jgi:GIY-YIG catalytic domain